MSTGSSDVVLNLMSALGTAFTPIVIGYSFSRARLVSSEGVAGMGKLVGMVALPAILFRSMATLDLGEIDAALLASIAFGKGTVCAFAALTAFFFVNRESSSDKRLQKAAMYSLFVANSNDLAIGLPVIQALYPEKFVGFLLLAASFTLLVLNPIGLTMLEISKSKADPNARVSFSKIFQSVLTNPVVALTVAGLIFNLCFGHRTLTDLKFINNTLTLLGNGFPVMALFLLGFGAEGRINRLKGTRLFQPLFLITLKVLILPILTRFISAWLVSGSDKDLKKNFAYIYGSFPTAPSVAVILAPYGIGREAIPAASVLCLVASAPIMVSATVLFDTPDDQTLNDLIQSTGDAVDYAAILSTLFTVLAFYFARSGRKFPNYLISLLSGILGLSALFHSMCLNDEASGTMYIFDVFLRMWSRLIVVFLVYVLLSIARGSLPRAKVLTKPFLIGSAAFSFVWTMIIAFAGEADIVSPFQKCVVRNGDTDRVMTLISSLSFFVIIGLSFPTIERLHKRSKLPAMFGLVLSPRPSEAAPTTQISEAIPSIEHTSSASALAGPGSPDPAVDDEEDEEKRRLGDKFRYQIVFTVVLVDVLLLTFIALSLLSGDSLEGSVLQIVFLSQLYGYGQPVFILAAFALQREYVHAVRERLDVIRKAYRKFVFGAEDIARLVTGDCQADERLKEIARSLIAPEAGLARKRRHLLKTYNHCLVGSDVVSFLISTNVAVNRDEAVRVGRRLVESGLLRHVTDEHHFEDKYYFYVIERNLL